jgi:Transcription-silencing protein Clr2
VRVLKCWTEIAAVPRPTSSTGALHPTQNREQEVDSEANGKFMYRPGEMVWFNRGAAWGLSVICKRQEVNSKARYLLQPLSHPLNHPPAQIKDQDAIRPWLAWSVPVTTHSQIANLHYEEVPWDRVLRGELGVGDAEVDGSILAAKSIDGCYTFFDRLPTPTPTAGTGDVYYSGMFLGAEKIWVGEPVRLRLPNKSDIAVMVVQQMAERVTESASHVTITGDIYKFVEIPVPYKDRKEWPTPDLPARMAADLRFRNEVADNAKRGTWCEWRLIERMASRSLNEIKGRWYETRSLLPVLRGAEYQQDLAKGISSDAGLWMNSRGDSSNGLNQRKKNRVDTLGKAVPSELKISRGLNGRPEDDRFPDEQQSLSQIANQMMGNRPYAVVPGTVEQDLDQFMNLDHVAEHQDFYNSVIQH